MEQSVLTAVFLPLALAFIMLGMGLTLSLKDFKNVIIYPKAMILGLINQLLLLPLFGFFLVYVFNLEGAMAVGIMILAACPGGPTSNLITHLSKGDTALSISLTAISSFVTILSIPLIVNLAIVHFGEEGSVTLPVGETILQIMGVTLIPVSIGMFLKSRLPILSRKADRPVRIASAVFFSLIVFAAIFKERENLVSFFQLAGPATLTLNLTTLLLGYLFAKVFLLNKRQQICIAVESGIQNGTLGIMVAATLLNNSAMTIPVAIYSLIMFITAAFVIFIANKAHKG
ncbi:bile acid:sodium symporter family protein [Pleomorphovibrio marinus]|uniref:bile acid:sodium symporter family protein n=1 Tax=Pleomorphovibrio marinus TaxID=2164132 RepID=UPI000E0AC81F|nr:bile acid:sodium symporter family protein [Pleomorphovibrio marinus]